VRKLALAALISSDKPAANILRKALGGPARMTALWRSIGDDVSRLDCYEPELNLVPTNEFRDTTTPAATACAVAKIIYGDVLPERAERNQAVHLWRRHERSFPSARGTQALGD